MNDMSRIPPELREIILPETAGEKSQKPQPEAIGSELLSYWERINDDVENFSPGQLVQWKPGMKFVKNPDYGDPMLVIRISEDHQRDERRENDGHDGIRQDVLCAFQDHTRDHPVIFHIWLDARRIQTYSDGINC